MPCWAGLQIATCKLVVTGSSRGNSPLDGAVMGSCQPSSTGKTAQSTTRISEMAPVRKEAVMTAPFGRVGSQEARVFTLDNDEITVRITDYGGRLVSIEAPDRRGRRA